jgi:hypothetical protein
LIDKTNKDKKRVAMVAAPAKDRQGNIDIWNNREELRTVFGLANISEMKLRMETGKPLRYLYQDSQHPFYELVKTVLRKAIQSEYVRNEGATENTLDGAPYDTNKLVLGLVELKATIYKLPNLPLELQFSISESTTKPQKQFGQRPPQYNLEFTKTKLLPHLLGEDIYAISDEDKKRILDAQMERYKTKARKQSVKYPPLDKQTPVEYKQKDPKTTTLYAETNTSIEQRFNRMVLLMKTEQEKKIATASGTEFGVIPRLIVDESKRNPDTITLWQSAGASDQLSEEQQLKKINEMVRTIEAARLTTKPKTASKVVSVPRPMKSALIPRSTSIVIHK